VRKLLSKHFRKIIETHEEPFRTNAYDERWVDVYTYSCKHQYWQEKGGNLEEGICDSCLMGWLLDGKFNLKFAKWIWKVWNNKMVRWFIHE
jgi:hypothetical protein